MPKGRLAVLAALLLFIGALAACGGDDDDNGGASETTTTATATGSDLAALAAAAGVPRTATVRTVDELRQAFAAARAARELAVIVAKVEPVGPPSYALGVHLLENRFEFERWLRAPGGAGRPGGDP